MAIITGSKTHGHDFPLNIKRENLMPLNIVSFNWHDFFHDH